jgi:hypothetical protein
VCPFCHLVGGVWLEEVVCVKVASINVEVVFSGAGCISMKSHCLDPQFLRDFDFLSKCDVTA